MEIHWSDGTIRLEQAQDFKSFKLVATGPTEHAERVARDFLGVARFDGPASAWVSRAGLQSLAGERATPTWLQSVQAMVDKARPHGWIDPATGDIRAHVEWR